ncbi:hypothetical protein J3B02_003692 [Coemansia erecta]|nr:hypothetical protein J3B02_003692 [Coemansia erecta]
MPVKNTNTNANVDAHGNGQYYAEHQKMLAGEMYTAKDPYLALLRRRCRYKVGNLAPARDDPEVFIKAIKELLGTVADDNAIINSPVFFDYGRNTHVGERFYMNGMCVILDCGRVDIGDDAMIGPGVHIYTADHPVDPKERLKRLQVARPVKVGNSVWIGGHAVILPGVTIGDNVTVGAGSVVTKDVPDNVVVAGNPARIIRYL